MKDIEKQIAEEAAAFEAMRRRIEYRQVMGFVSEEIYRGMRLPLPDERKAPPLKL